MDVSASLSLGILATVEIRERLRVTSKLPGLSLGMGDAHGLLLRDFEWLGLTQLLWNGRRESTRVDSANDPNKLDEWRRSTA